METKQLALITGVGKETGIGYETARQLGILGYQVIISSRNAETAERLAGQLRKENPDIVAMALDISKEDIVKESAIQIDRQFGKLDVLINNATLFPDRFGTVEVELDDVRKVLDNNFIGAWSMIKYFTPLLRKSEHPRIVNVSSAAGSYSDERFGLLNPPFGIVSVYGLSKLVTNGLTLKAAIDLKPYEILVNAADPDFTASYNEFAALGARPVEVSARSIVLAATLPKGGPTGKFFRDGAEIGW